MSSFERKRGFKRSGHNCCALGCSHKSGIERCSFYSFPKDSTWFDKWVDAVKRCAVDDNGKVLPHKRWIPESHHRLCSCHFSICPNPASRKIGWNHVLPDRLPGVRSRTPRSTVRSTSRRISEPAIKRRKIGDDIQVGLCCVCVCYK